MNKFFRFLCTALLMVQPILGEAVNYPTSLDDYTSLYQAVNNVDTNLDGDLNATATSITVDSTSSFPLTGHIQIDGEVIYYTSKVANQFRGCTRGSDGTSATTHSDNASVKFSVIAAHHNILVASTTAIETELGLNPSGTYTSVLNRLDAIGTALNSTITLAGDLSGTGYLGVTLTASVTDDSHNHTGSTISGLGVGDFTSSAVSQFFNDSGYQTSTGTVANFSGSLSGNVSGTQGNTIVNVTHTAISDFDYAVTTLTGDTTATLTGDVTGTLGANKVDKIENIDVSSTAPSDGQVLTYDNSISAWIGKASAGGGTWGSITGTLDSQTDLKNALDAKVNVSDTANWNTAYGWGDYSVASLGGDATGTIGNVAITDDSHAHTGSTISGLGVGDFTSSAVSQFFNDAGYKTTDSDTTYTAGNGLQLTGTTFSAKALDSTITVQSGGIGVGTLADSNIPDAITLSSSATVDAGSLKSGTVTASVDAGSKSLEIPNGTSLPATCNVGEVYSLSNASANEQFYVCSAENTWSLQNGTLIAAKMTHSTNIVVTAAYQSLSYDTEEYDYGNLCSTTTTRFNVTETGVYAYGMVQSFGSADVRVALRIVKNNTTLLAQDFRSTGTSSIANLNAQSVLVPNDYLEFRSYATNTTTANASSANDVSGAYIAKIGNSSSSTNGVSVNGLQGAVTITGGTGITVTSLGTTITVSGSSAGTLSGATAYNNADITITSGAWYDINLNSEDSDTGNYHSTSSNTARMTITDTGRYLIVGNLQIQNNANEERIGRLLLNNTNPICINSHIANNLTYEDIPLVTIRDLNAGDYITMQIYQNSGSPLNVEYGNDSGKNSPYLNIERLR